MRTSSPRLPDDEPLDLAAPLRRLRAVTRRHRLLVLGTTLLTVGLVLGWTRLFPPTYEAKVTLYMEPQRDATRERFYDEWNIFRGDDAASQTQLVTSTTSVRAVVEQLDLSYDEVYHPPLRHLAHLWRGSWLGQQWQDLRDEHFPEERTPWDPEPAEVERARTVTDFQAGLSMKVAGLSTVAVLTTKAPTRRAAEMANALADEAVAAHIQRHREEALAAYDALTLQVERARGDMLAAEQRVRSYKDERAILFDFEREKTDLAQLAKVTSLVDDAVAAVAASAARLASVEEQLVGEPTHKITTSGYEKNVMVETLLHRLLDLRLARQEAATRWRDDSIEVRDLDLRVALVENMLTGTAPMLLANELTTINEVRENLLERRNQIATELAGQRSELAALQAQKAAYDARLNNVPEAFTELQMLAREQSLAEEDYRMLLDKQLQAWISAEGAATASTSLRIIDRAVPPDAPVWPKTKLFLGLALVVGLLMGVAAAQLRELLDNRVRAAQYDASLAGVPFYAEILLAQNGDALPLVPRAGHRRAAAPAGDSESRPGHG
ncbi:MAG: GNVR domain-containing protein [Planctomycetota bacterium]